MSLQKRDMVVGQKVRGYGLLNEYGEFEFIPEQTGSRKGKIRLITQGEGYSVSQTRDKLVVHFSFSKVNGDRLRTIQTFCSLINNVLLVLQKYEF